MFLNELHFRISAICDCTKVTLHHTLARFLQINVITYFLCKNINIVKVLFWSFAFHHTSNYQSNPLLFPDFCTISICHNCNNFKNSINIFASFNSSLKPNKLTLNAHTRFKFITENVTVKYWILLPLLVVHKWSVCTFLTFHSFGTFTFRFSVLLKVLFKLIFNKLCCFPFYFKYPQF